MDFIEGVTENSYSITAVAGYVLLKDGENARDYRALNGYFLDGGRRNSHIVGQITINDMMNADQVIEITEHDDAGYYAGVCSEETIDAISYIFRIFATDKTLLIFRRITDDQ